jgi:hypothetical protein
MLSPWTVSVKMGLRNVSYKNSSSVLWFSENEKTLDEAVARDPALVLQSNTRVVRESNPLNLSVFTDVLQTGSQVMYEKTIDEVMCQRIYGALPLSYGAMI